MTWCVNAGVRLTDFSFSLVLSLPTSLNLPLERPSFMFSKIMSTSATWVTVPIRLGLAAVMIAHGSQKVLGVFGGPGFKAWTAGTTPFAFMRPAWLWLGAAALSELLGGALVALGFLTRIGAFVIGCTMLTAIAGIHWPGGFFASNRGYEYPLALFAMAFALLIGGGGQASVDRAFAGERRRR